MTDPDDDLDRLFAATPAPPPPSGIGVRARARLRAIRQARRLTVIALLDVVALLTLALLAFLLGASFARSDVPALLRLMIEDRALAFEARREFALALVDSTPWIHVLGTALSALALFLVTVRLLRACDALIRDAGASR